MTKTMKIEGMMCPHCEARVKKALEALDARQNVFLEKPLCLTLEEFTALKSAYEKAAADSNPPRLCLGFNRRFAPLALELKKRLSGFAPMSIVYRVDAGAIPQENWIQNLSLLDAMGKLPEREKNIIELRFYSGKTQMEVADEIGISQAQVSRLEKNALKTMRMYLSS